MGQKITQALLNDLITELQDGLNVQPETIVAAFNGDRSELHRKLDFRLDRGAELQKRSTNTTPQGGKRGV